MGEVDVTFIKSENRKAPPMENILKLSQPALIAAADRLLDLVDRVLERHSNITCFTAIEGCTRSIMASYSGAGQQTSLHARLAATAY
jgi:hypothetical protein